MVKNRYPVTVYLIILVAFGMSFIRAETTVDVTDRYAWLSNVGWVDFYADGTHGANFNQTIVSGYIYAANIGWIHLGDGSPTNGVNYGNDSADDFGVNVDSISDPDFFILSGHGWSDSTGWINFDVAAQAGNENQPRIEKQTGILRGFAWSSNLGWLALDSPGIVNVQTGITESRNAAARWELYP